MTGREKLLYLINGLIDGSYNIKIFCSEFTRIFNLEVNYDEFTDIEDNELRDLCELAERFSDDADELKIPHMYFSEEVIVDKAKRTERLLKQG